MAGKIVSNGVKLTRHDKFGCKKPVFLWFRGIHVGAIWLCDECGQHWKLEETYDWVERTHGKKWVRINKPANLK